MTRKTRKSIYKEKINEINISDIFGTLMQESYDPEWSFNLEQDWMQKLNEKLQDLNFYFYDYTSSYGSFWSGILTLEPFDRLTDTIGREETILNVIREHHIKMEENQDGFVIVRFHNPSSSPLYRFFNQYKEDGFGENIPYSINALLNKIEEYLKEELTRNMTYYGEWVREENIEDDIA